MSRWARKLNKMGYGKGFPFDIKEFGDSVVIVSEESDLPSPDSNDNINLEEGHLYFFENMISSTASLMLGANTPIIGLHAGKSGFIHTGEDVALKSVGNVCFLRDISFSAPGGTIFDLDGENNIPEFLVESCSFNDFAGLGDIASLGTIKNYRVPTFKGCNFENFASGLQFEGQADKIFFDASVFRDVSETTTDPVTIINFDENFDIDIADITDCYVKGVQADTVFWNIETGGKPNQITILKGTTFDDSITKENILTGEADPTSVRVKTDSNYPLANSSPFGSLVDSPDVDHTVVGSGTDDTLIEMTASQELMNDSKISNPSNGVLQYDDVYDVRASINITLQVTTTTDSFVVKLYRSQEGSEEWNEVPAFSLYGSKRANETAATVTGSSTCEVNEDCQFALYIQNLDDDTDLNISNFNLSIG